MNQLFDPRQTPGGWGSWEEWWQGMMRAWLASLTTDQQRWLETQLSVRIPIPIGSGGTGAITAAQARQNLGIGEIDATGGIPEPPADGRLYGREAAVTGLQARGARAAATGAWVEVLPAESVRSGQIAELPAASRRVTLSNADLLNPTDTSNAGGIVRGLFNKVPYVLASAALLPGDYDLYAAGDVTHSFDSAGVAAPGTASAMGLTTTFGPVDLQFAIGPQLTPLTGVGEATLNPANLGATEASNAVLFGPVRCVLTAPQIISLIMTAPGNQFIDFAGVLPGGSPMPAFTAAFSLGFEGQVYFRRYQLEEPSTDSPEIAPGQLRSFYVSADGNDTNDGSRGSPWKTVARVNAFAKQPGDAFMFRAGDTFSGKGIETTTSGTAANPIFFRSYGSKDERATLRATAGDVIAVRNAAYVTISDLSISGTPSGWGVRLTADSADMTKYAGNQLRNLDVSLCDYGGILITNPMPEDDDGSTATTPPTINPGFADLLIDGCVIHDNGDGLQTYSEWSRYLPDTRRNSHRNITVRNCISCRNDGRHQGTGGYSPYGGANVHGSGFVIAGVDGALVENCVAYENGVKTAGALGIWCYDCNNVVFRYCESYRNHTAGSDGGGFDIDGGSTNCVMEYCYSHGNDNYGYQYWPYTGSPPTFGNVVRFCVTENDSVKFHDGDSFHIGSFDSPHGECVFHNCVAYQNQDREIIKTARQPQPSAFFNNIFIAEGKCWSFVTNTNNSPMRFNGNNYVGQPYPTMFWWGPSWTAHTLQSWRAATGMETLAAADTSQVWPHGLTNAGNGGTLTPLGQTPTPAMFAGWLAYQLTAASQNRNAGLDIQTEFGIDPGPHDMFGNPVTAATLSIGAHCP